MPTSSPRLLFSVSGRKTSDRPFLHFALAFGPLLALNQIAGSVLGAADERTYCAYIRRVLGFVIILVAMVDKNLFALRKGQVKRARTRAVAHAVTP